MNSINRIRFTALLAFRLSLPRRSVKINFMGRHKLRGCDWKDGHCAIANSRGVTPLHKTEISSLNEYKEIRRRRNDKDKKNYTEDKELTDWVTDWYDREAELTFFPLRKWGLSENERLATRTFLIDLLGVFYLEIFSVFFYVRQSKIATSSNAEVSRKINPDAVN